MQKLIKITKSQRAASQMLQPTINNYNKMKNLPKKKNLPKIKNQPQLQE